MALTQGGRTRYDKYPRVDMVAILFLFSHTASPNSHRHLTTKMRARIIAAGQMAAVAFPGPGDGLVWYRDLLTDTLEPVKKEQVLVIAW